MNIYIDRLDDELDITFKKLNQEINFKKNMQSFNENRKSTELDLVLNDVFSNMDLNICIYMYFHCQFLNYYSGNSPGHGVFICIITLLHFPANYDAIC